MTSSILLCSHPHPTGSCSPVMNRDLSALLLIYTPLRPILKCGAGNRKTWFFRTHLRHASPLLHDGQANRAQTRLPLPVPHRICSLVHQIIETSWPVAKMRVLLLHLLSRSKSKRNNRHLDDLHYDPPAATSLLLLLQTGPGPHLESLSS